MIDVDGSVCGYFEGAELGHSIGWMDVRRGWYGVFIFNNLRMDSSWGPPRIMITRATPDEDYVNTNCINTKTLYYISNTSWSCLTWAWDHMRWHWCTDGQSNTSYHFLYWPLSFPQRQAIINSLEQLRRMWTFPSGLLRRLVSDRSNLLWKFTDSECDSDELAALGGLKSWILVMVP